MAKKKTKNKKQQPVESNAPSKSTYVLRIMFVIFSIMIVLSMVLAATASLY